MVSFVTDLWSAAVHGGKQRRQVTVRIYTIFCWSKVCLCLCEATKDKIPLYPLSCNTRKESFLLVKCLWHDHPFRKILYNIAFEYSRFFSLIAAGNVSRSLTRFLTNLRHQYGIYGIADVSHVKRPLQRGASGNGCIRSRLCTTEHNEQYHRIVNLFYFFCLPFHTKPYFRPKFRLQIQICFFNLHRNCIGMNFAMAEMRVAVAMILRRLACLRLK